MEETPRPTIETDLPEGLGSLYEQRRRDLEQRMPVLTFAEKQRMCHTVSKYRNKQTALLGGECCSDPYPFSPAYVFYCFQGVVEE